MYPIVMVANFSGNVGKTTITKNLLAPNMPNVRIFAVEDVNAGYNQGEATQMSADMAKTILEEVLIAAYDGPIIVDVGASNVSVFFSHFSSYEGIHEMIARVVIPTEASEKVQIDTVKTVEFLTNELQFDVSKISVIINKADPRMSEEIVFEYLLTGLAQMGVLPVGTIYKNDTYQTVSQLHTNIYELATGDVKQMMQEGQFASISGEGPRAKVRLALASSSSKQLKRDMDALFAKLDIRVDDTY